MNHIAEIMEGLAAELEAERNPAADRIRAGLRKAELLTEIRKELASAAKHLGSAIRQVHEGHMETAKAYHELSQSCLNLAGFYGRELEES